MRLALLFSGQGGQRPEHWQQLRAEAGGSLRASLWQVLPGLLENKSVVAPVELLRNSIAQPLIFAWQMLLWEKLKARLPRPICAAGYSLGEMAACSAAGLFTAAQGVVFCAERAAAMDRAATGEQGMLAVLGLSESLVQRLAAENGLALAIRNAPRHLVVAGPRAGLLRMAQRCQENGASHLVHLAVQTPSHTAALTSAAADFQQVIAALPDCRLAFPVFSAIDATAARSGRAARDALARQICTRLDWAACLQSVLEMQPDVVLEIGPGNAMSKLFSELAPEIPSRASDDFRSIDGMVSWLESRSR